MSIRLKRMCLYLILGTFQMCIAFNTVAQEITTEELMLLEERARQAAEAGDQRTQLLILERLAKFDANNPQRYLNLAKLAESVGQWPVVAGAAEKLRSRLPGEERTWYYSIKAAMQTQEWQHAKSMLEVYIKQFPNEEWAWQALAIAYDQTGNPQAADATLAEMKQKLYPEH